MKKFLTLLLLCGYFLTQAQVIGKITDVKGEPLPGASIAAYTLSKKLVNGATADSDGRFALKLEPGKYILEISFIAYESILKNIDLPENGTLDLGTLKLVEANTSLEEVVVKSKANAVEFKQDKRVYNVAKDISNIGQNASDILGNIPSISMDVDGNLSLRGSQNVRILINGKPSGLVGNDPANALRQLQGSMIEKIEVITNPSARYDAEGEAGIINIILKKDDRAGINGVFEVTGGYPDNYQGSATINYRKGKLNWFASGNIGYRKSPGGGTFTQQFYDAQKDSAWTAIRDYDRYRGGINGNLRFGMDYNITPSQTLTGAFLYHPNFGDNLSDIIYKDFDSNGSKVSTVLREDHEREKEADLEGNLHYEKKFKGEDHKLTADVKYENSVDHEASDITQDTLGSLGQLFQKVSNREDEQNMLAQIDYVHPYSKYKSFELGSKFSSREIINNYSVSNQREDGGFNKLDSLSNNFRYLETIYAAYGIYNDRISESVTYQLGLRAEYTDIQTELLTEKKLSPKSYINLFPSAFLTWHINKQSDLQINYSRRISRPHFRWLLPFSNYTDPRNLRVGNPDLNPEFTDSYEAGLLHYWEHATLYSGIYYRHRTGVTERITMVDEDGRSITMPINLAVQDAYGFEFNYSQDVGSWLRLMGNLNLYRAITVGKYGEVDYGSDNFSSQGRISSRFSFWKSDLQLSLNYFGPQTRAQGSSKAITSADLGWSKDILKGNGTLTFSIRDIFNSRKWRSTTITTEPIYSETNTVFQWRQRQFLLNFTYRLNQSKRNAQKGRGGEDMDEGAGEF